MPIETVKMSHDELLDAVHDYAWKKFGKRPVAARFYWQKGRIDVEVKLVYTLPREKNK
jgi:hypothetical protein